MQRVSILEKDEELAVKELATRLGSQSYAGVLFFCSSNYNPRKLSEAFATHFACPFFGCTTAGELGDTYEENSLIAVGLPAEKFRISWEMVNPLKSFTQLEAYKVGKRLYRTLGVPYESPGKNVFAICLIDGLSGMEGRFTLRASNGLCRVPLVGGSAADDYKFSETTIFCSEEYSSDAAMLLLVETALDFETFQFQHFVPGQKKMKITEADPFERVVFTIDGVPAAQKYAETVGVGVDELSDEIFGNYPMVLEIGNEYFIRSLKQANPDGSLTFFCGISEGDPMSVGVRKNLIKSLNMEAELIADRFEEIDFSIIFDCMIRRQELKRLGELDETSPAFEKLKMMGMNSYGELYQGLHVNQTMTGITFGKKK